MTDEEARKRRAEGKVRSRVLTRPMYGNCLVVAPDGTPLFRCQEHRIDWYLSRNLAERICENPPTIRLLFNPKGNGNAGDPYMLGHKHNICVVCGADKDLTKHHIVPYCYKTHFPMDIREHASYDVLPVCVPCHEQYERHASLLKEQIFIEYGVSAQPLQVNEVALAAIRSARAIQKHKSKIPAQRLEVLKARIGKHFGKPTEEVGDADIKMACDLEIPVAPERYIAASGQVVAKIADFDEFAYRWRRHFISIMNPKCMPATWDINKKIYRKN